MQGLCTQGGRPLHGGLHGGFGSAVCRGFVVRGKEVDRKATAGRVEEGELAERHAAAKRVWKGRWQAKHGTHVRRRVRAQRPAMIYVFRYR